MPTLKGNKIYGYCRASTAKQTESPDTQKQLIYDYVSMNQLGIVDSFFVDSATSGKVPMIDREAGREILARIKKGDILVIAKLDRAFRRLSDAVKILEHLERIGTKFHVCNMAGCAMDLSSPMGKFVIHIFAAFAEMERDFIKQRTKEGIDNAIMKGKFIGNCPGYGFEFVKTKNADGTVGRIKRPCHHERAVMKEIAMMRLQVPPVTWYRIHKILNDRGEVTKDGRPWKLARIMSACQAEFKIQQHEQRSSPSR